MFTTQYVLSPTNSPILADSTYKRVHQLWTISKLKKVGKHWLTEIKFSCLCSQFYLLNWRGILDKNVEEFYIFTATKKSLTKLVFQEGQILFVVQLRLKVHYCMYLKIFNRKKIFLQNWNFWSKLAKMIVQFRNECWM